MPVKYRFSLGDHSVGASYGFEPQSPQITWFLSGQPHTFTCTLDADNTAAVHAQELVDDIWIWREQDGDKDLVFRGPYTATPNEQGGSDGHGISISALSYRYRLTRLNTNLVASNPTTGVYNLGSGSAPTLAWGLIAYHIAAPNDLNGLLVNGWSGTGANLTNAGVATGTDLAAAIDSLAAANPFDWDLVPQVDDTVQFQAWVPQRGTAKTEALLQYIRKPGGRRSGGSNMTFNRAFDPGTYANKVYVVGQDVNGNQLIGYAGTDPGPAGSYTQTFSSSDLKGSNSSTTSFDTQVLLNRLAATKLAELQAPTASYTLTPDEGWWRGPRHLWLGDAPRVVIRSGPRNVNRTDLRAIQIQASPVDGNEGLQISVGAPPPGKNGTQALARTYRNIANRLEKGEWRS
jgi:hypothetical protein